MMTELQDLLVAAIKTFVVESPLNRLKDIDGSPMWQEPLVAFADGDDPLFALYKTVVGPFHLSPREAMSIVRSDSVPHVSIVSWILPAAEETRRSNREMTEGPSLRWNHSRFQGEEFNDCVRRYVVGLLEEKGYLAIAPVISPQFRTVGLANGPASTWSEPTCVIVAPSRPPSPIPAAPPRMWPATETASRPKCSPLQVSSRARASWI